jgi:dipeptide/tripeptide permease
VNTAEIKGEEAPKGGLQQKVSADTPKNKRQRFVIPKGIRVVIMVSYVSLNIHLHDRLHHTFAFINIHLDIYRIIIIITYTLASALKEKATKKREKRRFYVGMFLKHPNCITNLIFSIDIHRI